MSTLIETSTFITISFSILIIISALLLTSKLPKYTSDIYLLLLLLVSSILLLVSQNCYMFDCAHFLFMAYLYLVSIFSNNIYLLFLNICIFVVIIISRYYYKFCVLNNKLQCTGPFEKFNKYVNHKGTIDQGNTLFCGTILFLILKIVGNTSNT